MKTCKPLYKKYAGQTSAQDAHMQIDEGGEITFDYNPNIGSGIPADVYHGIRIWIDVSPYLSARDIVDLTDEARPLVAKLRAESVFEHDINGNYCRKLTDTGKDIQYQIERLCAAYVPAGEDCLEEGCEYCTSNYDC